MEWSLEADHLKRWYLRGSDKNEGWYAEARNLCGTLAERYGLDLEAVAGFVALLSPRVKWDAQEAWTERALVHVLSGGDLTALQCPLGFYSNRRKATAWLRGERFELSAKVACFYANILGDEARVTLDTWAVKAALQAPDAPKAITLREVQSALRKRSEKLTAAYVAVAMRYSTTPARVQARVWVAIRGE
jgi:hypothetical protein